MLQLFLIGAAQLLFDGKPIPQFRDEKVQALFAYLAIEARQRPIARAHLIDLLWPGYQTQSGQANLRSTLYRLRQLCLPYEPIQANRKEIRFSPRPGEFWCDWDASTLNSAAASSQEGTRSPDLMEGFHLPDCPAFMQWLDDQRTRLRRRPAQTETRSASSSPNFLNDAIPDHRLLVGRESQLAQLHTWLIQQPGRVVGIFGIGGQGKTTLAATFARSLDQKRFERILWATLVNAPAWPALFAEWVHALTDSPPLRLPDHLEGQLALLLRLAHQHSTLFVLDNLETILEAGEVGGRFLPGYDAYGQFLERMAQSAQGSAVLLTSREQPAGFARWLQSYRGVHRLRLHGLDEAEGEQLLRQYISAPSQELSTLTRHFSGNPLALLLAARTVSELFADDISAFLALDSLVFGDVREVLTGQFERLTRMEQQILYQLALAREPLVWPELRQSLPVAASPGDLLESLHSLSGAVVNRWNLPALSLQESWTGHQRRISGLTFHPDGQLVASASADTSVRLWDAGRGLLLHTLWGHERPVQRALFHPNRPLLVSASSDGILCVWQVKSGALLGKVQAHRAWISDLIAAGDGAHLISCGGDARIRLWSIDENDQLILQKEFALPVRKDYGPVLALLPAIGQVAFGTEEGIYLCDLAGGALEHRFPYQPAWTMALAASPDGRWLAAAFDTKRLNLWDVQRGQLGWSQALEYAVEALAFSPDSARIYFGDAEGYLEIWHAARGERVERKRIPGPYEGMKIRGVTGISQGQLNNLLPLGAVER